MSKRMNPQDPERAVLVGGAKSVTLGAAEARLRRDGRRQVMLRSMKPVFGAAVEPVQI